MTFTSAEGNTDVSTYEAGNYRRVCEVSAGASELHCIISGLAAGREYRIYAQVCMPTQECSYRSFAVATTGKTGASIVAPLPMPTLIPYPQQALEE